jgi:hypothetical protein
MTTYQTALNTGFSMAAALEGVTGELEMAILRVVMFHVGAENRISRTELVAEVHAQGLKQDERTIRLAVSEMRRKYGIPIAGTGGTKGGYWLLKNEDEAAAYLKVELHDRGTSLLEQEAAVRKSFNRWYPGEQLRLGQ